MIFEAFCSKYGIDYPRAPPQNKFFQLTPTSINAAVTATFDIKKIDHQMRDVLLKKTGDISAEFDALRKNYPKRYEFSRYHLTKNTENSLVQNLSKIGFKIT